MRGRGRTPAGEVGRLSAEEKLSAAEEALLARRALDLVALDMRELTLITDYFLICHGTSGVHIRALAEGVAERLEEQGVHPMGVEGYQESRWVLLDYGDLVVHIFAEEERGFYDLERLWGDARRVATGSPG
jgi:ribosome-associated protein